MYNFTINGHSVTPIWDSLEKIYEIESGYKFFRQKLNGKLTFLKDDYTWINSQAFDTIFIVTITYSGETYYQGKFVKTDGEWDIDNKKIVVSLEPYDNYDKILSSLNKEYDLIKLAPDIYPVIYDKRPLIQIYVPGDNVVTCFLGGTYWEQKVNNVVTNESTLTGTYKFSLASQTQEIKITHISGTLNPLGIVGTYAGKDGIYTKDDGLYQILYDNTGETPIFKLKSISSGIVYFTADTYSMYFDGDLSFNPILETGASGDVLAYGINRTIYARYLLDLMELNGTPTYPIPDDDILSQNSNYKRVTEYNYDCVEITSRYSTSPTEWGLLSTGKYFQRPTNYYYVKYYPIAKSQWINTSLWFNFDTLDYVLEYFGRQPYILNNAYSLSSAISRILSNFTTVTHLGTSEYSQFLYGTNPITSIQSKLFLTPNTNITNSGYTQAAQKGSITLGDILNALRDIFRVYWYIEDGKFKLEHISWFNNGKSYTPTEQVSIDLTTLMNKNKTWAYDTNKFRYDKIDMPQKYEFEWGDKCSSGFSGYPIIINSNFVGDNVEKVSVKFNTDIDFMLGNPDEINKDGMTLLQCTYDSTNLFTVSGASYGYYLNNNGTISLNTGYNTTDYIPIQENIKYTFSTKYKIAFYKHDHSFISYSIDRAITITSPDSAYYIKVSVATSDWSGYKILRGDNLSGTYKLPYLTRDIDGAELRLQNGLLSWVYLHPVFYTYDLPSSDVNINNDEYLGGITTEKYKKTDVAFPCLNDPDPYMLIKTLLGNGVVEKMTINLNNRFIKATLKYDTE